MSRHVPIIVRTNTVELIEAGYELFVTVPVSFEVASHITVEPPQDRCDTADALNTPAAA